MKFQSERERIMVLVAGLALALALYFTLFLYPTLRHISMDERALPRLQRDLDEARELAGRLARLSESRPKARSGSMLQDVGRIARELGIQVQDLKGFGNHGVQFHQDDLDGTTLVKLLYALGQDGIYPDTLEMHGQGKGLWSISLSVSGDGSGS
jgi:type II secretory pathway component PulM